MLHPTRTLEWVEERNWFFRLSAYADLLRALFASGIFFSPEVARNEILALIEQGLEDISASRARAGWGIPFPRDTGDGEAADDRTSGSTRCRTTSRRPGFPTRMRRVREVVAGADCTSSARTSRACTPSSGRRCSRRRACRSRSCLGARLRAAWRRAIQQVVRRALDLDEAIERFGTDAFRYFLMREVPFDADGNFSWERFDDRYNADLANSWGNLASRTIAMVEKFCGAVIPSAPPTELDASDSSCLAQYHVAMRANLPNKALDQVWECIARGNEFVDRQAPWKLAKDPEKRAELEATLASLSRSLVRQSIALSPFMPERCEALLVQLGAPFEGLVTNGIDVDTAGWRVARGPSLFPKDEPIPIA